MKHKTLWGLVLAIGGLFGALLVAQPFQDPLFHEFRSGDPSSGVYFGTVFPSLASTGTTPPDGVLFVEKSIDAADQPRMWIYSDAALAWNSFLQLTGGVGTADTVVKFDGAGGLEDSQITDDATDVVIGTVGDLDVNAAVDVTLDATAGDIILTTVGDDIILNTTGADDITITSADDINFTITDAFIVASDNFDIAVAAALIETTGNINLTTTDTGNVILTSIGDISLTTAAAGDDLLFAAGDDINLDGGTSTIDILDAGDIDLTPNVNVEVTVGQLLLPDGTEANPSIGNTGEVGTGMYFAAANFIGFNTSGTRRFEITDTYYGILVAGSAAAPSFRFPQEAASGMYRSGARSTGLTMEGALVVDFEAVNAAAAGADLVTVSSTLGIMDGAGDVVRFVYADVDSVDHTGGNILGFEADLDTADADSTETAFRATGAWDYTVRQAGVAFAALPAAEVGAMVYCTNCDLASVPCASTPGPGAWAFGTSTGPRWECPW